MPTQLDHYRLLGRSGLRVSPLSLGTMTFGHDTGWSTTDADAKRMLDHYVDRGGNFVDTANFYGMGGSEKVLAKLIQKKRQRLVISTKYSLTMDAGDPNAAGNQRKNMVQAVEASLKRMNTDYIDLLYLHLWDSRTPIDEILRGFDDLVRAGKILYIGVSDTPAWQISRMQAVAELRGWSQFCALQIPYSLTERTVEREYMQMALDMGLGVLPWSPLAGGVLSGKYSAADLKTASPTEIGQVNNRKQINVLTGRLTERTLAVAEVVKAVAAEMGRTPSQIALAWTLLNPAVTSPLIGARTMAQLEDNLASLEVAFSDDQIKRLDQSSSISMDFPHDMMNGIPAVMMFGGVTVESRGVRA